MIRVQPLPASALVRDYLAGAPAAQTFYPYRPRVLESFRAKLAAVSRRFDRAARERAARALRPTSERAAARLRRFVEQGGAVVTTGQQAGLFTGPLYTVYKALTASRLAGSLEEALGVPVLPVFWNASEDHDWEEVNHAFLLTPEHRVRRVSLAGGATHRPTPMSEWVLDEGVRNGIDELAHALGTQGDADIVLKWVRDAYRPGRSMAGAFSELLAPLLAPFDILLTDAADPELKAASVPVMAAALREAAEHEQLLVERTAAIEAVGYRVQVPILDRGVNLFYHHEGGRERLYRRADGSLEGNDTGVRLRREEALALMTEAPARFSPNVLLRPVVESAVFPTLAYVGGPGELSYFAQLNALFPALGMEPPVAYPRASVLLAEPRALQALEEAGLPLEALTEPPHEVATRLARAAVPAEVRTAMERAAMQITDGYRELIEAAMRLDPTLAGALGSLRNEALAGLAEGERRVVRSVKSREAARLERVERARAVLHPHAEPQERVLNALPFLARHGLSLLEEVHAALPISWDAAEG